jgi:glutamate/tyrosine decarboxylase-like PLP-dependent enzyme
MDTDALSHELEQCGEKGERPFALVATAGTTLNAAFDDLASFSAICRRFGTWFHVDAAHGGAAILSEKLRYKLAGLDSADSLSINPHKLMWISSPCSMLFVKDHRFLRSSLAVGLDRATYVVPDLCSLSEPPENSDPLQWTIACTRHFTALRIYSALITYGREGIAARLENVCRLARDLYTQLLRRKDEFEVLGLPELNIVCFRYRTNVGLMDINQQLRTKLAAGQEAYLTGCSVAGTYWLRAQIMSENVTESSNTALLSLLSKTAKDLIR